MLKAGLTDQEIVDTLIYTRKHHGDGLKFDNAQYYRRTIAKVRAQQFIEGDATEMDEAISPEERRAHILNHISASLGVTFTRMVKYTGSSPTYELHTEQGKIFLGTIEAIDSFTNFRRKVADATGKVIECDKQDWKRHYQAFLDACEVIEVPEANELVTLREYLIQYIEKYCRQQCFIDYDRGIDPFTKDGRVYILQRYFTEWLYSGRRIDRDSDLLKGIPRKLRQLGCEPTKINIEIWSKNAESSNSRKKYTSRYAYIIPSTIVNDCAISLFDDALDDTTEGEESPL